MLLHKVAASGKLRKRNIVEGTAAYKTMLWKQGNQEKGSLWKLVEIFEKFY